MPLPSQGTINLDVKELQNTPEASCMLPVATENIHRRRRSAFSGALWIRQKTDSQAPSAVNRPAVTDVSSVNAVNCSPVTDVSSVSKPTRFVGTSQHTNLSRLISIAYSYQKFPLISSSNRDERDNVPGDVSRQKHRRLPATVAPDQIKPFRPVQDHHAAENGKPESLARDVSEEQMEEIVEAASFTQHAPVQY